MTVEDFDAAEFEREYRTNVKSTFELVKAFLPGCLLYTSDAADDLLCVDLGGRRIIKKQTQHPASHSSTYQ